MSNYPAVAQNWTHSQSVLNPTFCGFPSVETSTGSTSPDLVNIEFFDDNSSFFDLLNSKQNTKVGQTISLPSIENSIRVLFEGFRMNLKPRYVQDLENGGIYIDYIVNNTLYAFEFLSEGETILTKRIGVSNPQIFQIEKDQVRGIFS